MSLRSGLVIEVPEAETAVDAFRQRMDRNAALGVPAHITVLFPFVRPADIDDKLLEQLAALFAQHPPFDFQLVDTGWFTDQNVLWLAPDRSEEFCALTAAIFAAFPDHPPWHGEFDEIVPHLTIGHDHPAEQMREAERQVHADLPIACRARSVSLFSQADHAGRWERRASFPLGSPPPDPYDLERFVIAQDDAGTYRSALAELRGARKVSHWMWFVFPQIAGLGQSPTSRYYAISGLDEARAYLAHWLLGPRLVECAAILDSLDSVEGHRAIDIFGGIDAQKLHSSMTLFARAASARAERELFTAVLRRYFGGVPDSATEARL